MTSHKLKPSVFFSKLLAAAHIQTSCSCSTNKYDHLSSLLPVPFRRQKGIWKSCQTVPFRMRRQGVMVRPDSPQFYYTPGICKLFARGTNRGFSILFVAIVSIKIILRDRSIQGWIIYCSMAQANSHIAWCRVWTKIFSRKLGISLGNILSQALI